VNDTNAGITVFRSGQIHIPLRADGFINMSVVAKGMPMSALLRFFDGVEVQGQVRSIVTASGVFFHSKYAGGAIRPLDRLTLLADLGAAGIVDFVPGAISARIRLDDRLFGLGPVDYGNGLWIHHSLGEHLVRWLERRHVGMGRSPLEDVVADAVAEVLAKVPSAEVRQQDSKASIAEEFRHLVSAEEFEELRKTDAALIKSGASEADRRDLLTARLHYVLEA
jgi:hypothetical protein